MKNFGKIANKCRSERNTRGFATKKGRASLEDSPLPLKAGGLIQRKRRKLSARANYKFEWRESKFLKFRHFKCQKSAKKRSITARITRGKFLQASENKNFW